VLQVDSELEIKPYYAGHVLGAAMFHVKVGSQSVIYTVSTELHSLSHTLIHSLMSATGVEYLWLQQSFSMSLGLHRPSSCVYRLLLVFLSCTFHGPVATRFF